MTTKGKNVYFIRPVWGRSMSVLGPFFLALIICGFFTTATLAICRTWKGEQEQADRENGYTEVR